ncbi:MAG: hypothetical protein QXO71_00790 [Candidatus Jordarchaeaceae archaeon]
MSGKPSYMLMLQIEHGEKAPIPFSETNLSSDKIVAIIDEQKNTLYLWLGKNCSDVTKRSATRTAQSIKKSGYAYGQLHIGQDLKEIKIVDESNLNDAEIRSNHAELTSIFKRTFTKKDQYVMEIGAKPQAAPTVKPAEKETLVPKPEPKIIVPKPAPAQVSAPEAEPTIEEFASIPEPKVSTRAAAQERPSLTIDPELIAQIKLGLLAVILGTKFSSYQFKSSLSEEGKPVYEFLSSGGSLCKVSLEGSDLIVFPDSNFGGMREEIIKLLKSKVSSLKF